MCGAFGTRAMKYSGERKALRSWKSLPSLAGFFFFFSSLHDSASLLQERAANGPLLTFLLISIVTFRQQQQQQQVRLQRNIHKLRIKKGHPCIRCYDIEIEVRDKKQSGGGGGGWVGRWGEGVWGGCEQRELLPTGSRALSALYINLCLVPPPPPPPPLPAPSHCRKYQRQQLFFNLRPFPLDYVPFFHPERWDVRWKGSSSRPW